MIMKKAGETFLAGCAVYVVMAACSGSDTTSFTNGVQVSSGGIPGVSGGSAGRSNQSGAPNFSGGKNGVIAPHDASPFMDALTHPVPDVQAAPTTVDAPCNIQVPLSTGSATYYYAEQQFPGKTVADLSRIAVLFPVAPGPDVPPGYPWYLGAYTYVRDGAVRVLCGTVYTSVPSTTMPPASVRFILPG